MFILTRRRGESIIIGDVIRVIILNDNERAGVKLGIEAPEDVRIWRGEIYDGKSNDSIDE